MRGLFHDPGGALLDVHGIFRHPPGFKPPASTPGRGALAGVITP
ncbi:MAG: hypothetical protein R6V49_00015 [Bacteroidales bacterium]